MKTVAILNCDDMENDPMSETLRSSGLSLSSNNRVLEEQTGYHSG